MKNCSKYRNIDKLSNKVCLSFWSFAFSNLHMVSGSQLAPSMTRASHSVTSQESPAFQSSLKDQCDEPQRPKAQETRTIRRPKLGYSQYAQSSPLMLSPLTTPPPHLLCATFLKQRKELPPLAGGTRAHTRMDLTISQASHLHQRQMRYLSMAMLLLLLISPVLGRIWMGNEEPIQGYLRMELHYSGLVYVHILLIELYNCYLNNL